MSEPNLKEARLQITPVDDGFLIQGQDVDGVARRVRQVASNLDELRTKLHALVDQVYVPIPESSKLAPPTAPTAKVETGGPAGTKAIT